MKPGKSRAQAKAEDRILEITSGAGRRSAQDTNGVSVVYRQLLSEVSDPSKYDDRPRKRRRVGEGSRAKPVTVDDDEVEDDLFEDVPLAGNSASNAQTIIDSEHSDESDVDDWEDVDTAGPAPSGTGDVGDVSIEVNANTATPKRKTNRKAITAADRSLALAVHKTHVLFLLFHAHIRNQWCHLKPVERSLRGVLSAKIIGLLNPKSNTQLRQSESFLEGIKLAVDIWRAKFKITSFGLHRPKWAQPDELDTLREKIAEDGESLDKAGFIKAAKSLLGSQDLGNQLFCALLRAVGVEARLICSLQPLPPTPVSQKVLTPSKAKAAKPRIYATFEHSEDGSTSEDSKILGGKAANQGPRRRLGQPTFGGPVGSYQHVAEATPKKRVRKLDYPIFWVEALNPAYSRWVVVDALVTGTISRATKIEPPASYEGNAMSYVLAFEEDGHAKDVTRRYARAYNAKTRKQRVESFPDGQKWWNAAMKPFRRAEITDKDQIEEAELTKKEASEGLPSSIQDFKDHPHYALERHLKRNEVIHPKREVGKINVGKASSSNLEPIYRRQDVKTVQSADRWYRHGREIKPGEQPLKHVPARSRRAKSPFSDDGKAEMAALYAYHQTLSYIPPPVVRGKVPKNVYGNIDIYVPTMIPAGGSHIKHPLAKKAAQLLKIDFADAVTGFQFKGRHGTAVIQGIVVATIHKEAVEATVQEFLDSQKQNEDDARSLECLRLWRRFLLGLQIAARIGLTDIHAANQEQAKEFKQELDDAEDEQEETVYAGGFFPDSGADDVAVPTSHLFQGQKESLGRSGLRSAPQDAESVTELSGPSRNLRRRKRLVVDDDDEEEAIYNPGADTREEPDTVDQHPNTDSENADMHFGSGTRNKGQQDNQSQSNLGFAADNEGGGFLADEDNEAGGFIPGEHDGGGGGFITGSYDDGGGGFLEGADVSEIPKRTTSQQEDEMMGGGFVPEDGNDGDGNRDENSASDLVHDKYQPHGDRADHSEPPPCLALFASRAIQPEIEVAETVEGQQADLEMGEEGSDSDHGSLLSHDPEDEDADPDWLDAD